MAGGTRDPDFISARKNSRGAAEARRMLDGRAILVGWELLGLSGSFWELLGSV